MKTIILFLLMSSVLSAMEKTEIGREVSGLTRQDLTAEYYLIRKQDHQNLQHLYSQLFQIIYADIVEPKVANRIRLIAEDLCRIYYDIKKLNNYNQDAIIRNRFSDAVKIAAQETDEKFAEEIESLISLTERLKYSIPARTDSQRDMIRCLIEKLEEVKKKNELTIKEKLSLINGKISLLEIQILQIEKKLKK